MTYPQYPGGDQSSGGQYPGGQYPGGQYPGTVPSHPGYADGEPPASGGTAIAAGVLAILGGLWAIFQALAAFTTGAALQSEMTNSGLSPTEAAEVERMMPDWLTTASIGTGAAQILTAILLLVGPILLFLKKSVGRWMVVAGCVLAIASAVAAYIMVDIFMSEMIRLVEERSGDAGGAEGMAGIMTAAGAIGAFIVAIPAIVTIVLALVPPTGRWCAQGKRKAAPAAYGPATAPPQW